MRPELREFAGPPRRSFILLPPLLTAADSPLQLISVLSAAEVQLHMSLSRRQAWHPA